MLDAPVVGCRAEKLTRGYSPSLIHRVHLEYASPAGGAPSVICKDSHAPWSSTDPDGLHREWFVYSECLSRVPTVGPALLHVEHSTEANRLVLADLGIDHHFPPLEHMWTHEELKPALETLALLHISAESLPLEEYSLLMPAPDRRWESHTIHNAVRILVDDHTYGDQGRRLLSAVELLLERQADQLSVWQTSRTLLHSDFNCSNVALERAGGGPARLIDWHIAASGMPAFEVASLFFQPYHNHRNLDRRTVLGDYLDTRKRLSGDVKVHADEEWAAFCYATAGNGMSYLPPVARQLETSGALQGWWSNMLAAIDENLTWCASL